MRTGIEAVLRLLLVDGVLTLAFEHLLVEDWAERMPCIRMVLGDWHASNR
jgi:hypothetical protein